jgi:hypothetical protein
LPANFFRINPGLQGGANERTDRGWTHYDSLQIEVRRRLSQGLQVQASYAYGDTWASSFYSLRKPLLETIDTGTEGSVRHAFKADWVYELPFGRGKRFAGNVNSMMDRIVGGWAFAGTARIQSPQLVDFGNVRLVGMTAEELKNLYGIYEFPQIFTENAPCGFIGSTGHRREYVPGQRCQCDLPDGYGPQGRQPDATSHRPTVLDASRWRRDSATAARARS